MKNSVILLVFFLIAIVNAKAQKNMAKGSDYTSAIGGRLGVPISFSYKHFITKAGALEGNAGFAHESYGFNYFRIGGMYQHHFPIAPVEGLKWYVGGGAFIDFYSYDNYARNNKYSKTSPGINGVGGIDYKFKTVPLNLSADWTPSIFLGRDLYYSAFRPGYGAVSVRYVLK